MHTIITMLMELKKADRFSPGCHVSIENEPYMRLVIEYLEERGPDGHPVISIAHYGEQNGDAMRDPEMLFQLIRQDPDLAIEALYYRNDYVGVEEWSRYRDDQDRLIAKLKLQSEHERFASMWALALEQQGFPDALTRTLSSPTAGL